MEARNRLLPEWFNRIQTGQLRLPRFQRFEAWSYSEVTGLLETVLRALPAGAALILEVGDSEPFVSRTMVGAPRATERCTEHLLDGQQRLTALWRSLNDDYPDRSFFVRQVPPEGDTAQEGGMVVGQPRRFAANGARYPAWADDPRGVHSRGLIPLRLLRPGDLGNEIGDWCDQATAEVNESRQLERLIAKLRETVISYNIPYLSLPVGTQKDVALEVFIKMNTSSVRLGPFDIVVAQLEEATGQSLHDLVTSLQARVPPAPCYREIGNWVLDVASLREDRPPTQASYQRLDLVKLERDWDAIVEGIGWATEFLAEERVFDGDRLPTVAVLPVLAALHSELPHRPDELGNARGIVRAYLWRAFFTQRYEQAAATASLQDFRGLREALRSGAGTAKIPIFDENAYPLPTTTSLRDAGWPKNREILARAVLALSLRAGARDLADDSPVTRENVGKREYHHLFPHAVLTRDGGVPAIDSYRALNCALITCHTNKTIGGKFPLQYLRERADAANLGEAVLRDRLASHLVPYNELAAAGWDASAGPEVLASTIRRDYEAFLEARAALMMQPVQDLCEGRAPTKMWVAVTASSR